MKTYNIKVTETYVYYINVEANSEKEALLKIKSDYENNEIEGVFVADANTIENTKFKISR
jgi:hypothetical protein